MRPIILLICISLLAACAGPDPRPTPAAALPSLTPAAPPSTGSGQAAAPSPTPAPTMAPRPTPAATPSTGSGQAIAPSPTPAPRYDLVLEGGRLIDGTGGPPVERAAVAISAGRIVAVARAGELPYAADTPVLDLSGLTILPGFINAHAHTSGLSDDELRAWTRAGVTTLRDLGGPPADLVARRERLAAAADPGLPRLLVAGPVVNVAGSFSDRIYGRGEGILLVAGPDDARARIGALLDQGVDLVKLAVSGRTDVSWAELSDAELAAIVETAAARGARVSAHVDRASALGRAVAAGVADAAHSPRDRIPDELIARMVRQGVGLVPTIDVYEALAESRGGAVEWRRIILPAMYDNLRRFAAAGGTLALGDDYGGAPGMAPGMPMAEIEHWLAAGLSPADIIVAGTLGGATVCGLEGEIGSVEPGKIADILVVRGDPLAEIGALARPALVLRGGAVAFQDLAPAGP